METGKALEIVHNMARRHFDSVGVFPAQTDDEAKDALNTVEDFIVNNFGEDVHPKMQTLQFIAISDLIPQSFGDLGEFLAAVGEDAPFSFGDNDRTLILASRFADWCENCVDRLEDNGCDNDEVNKFIAELWKLDETYIDLEN